MRISAKIALVVLCMMSGLALAVPVQVAPGNTAREPAGARPKVTKEVRFESWGLSCAVALDARGSPLERCMVSQRVAIDPEGQKVVLGVTVDYADSPAVPTMRIRFSARANVKAGIGIKIDERPEMRLAINNCNSRRCESVGRLTPKVLKLWRRGKNAQVAFIEPGGKQVLVPVSLSGFDAALSALGGLNIDKK